MMKLWLLITLLLPQWAFAKTVLIVDSYGDDWAWNQDYVEAVKQTLHENTEVIEAPLLLQHIPKSHFKYAAESVYQRYLQIQPDVVVLVDDNAFETLYPMLYLENADIVFVGVNKNPRAMLERYTGRARVTGVIERPNFLRTLGDVASILDDEHRKILMLFDAGTTGKATRTSMQAQYELFKNELNVDVQFMSASTERGWQRMILTAKARGFGAVILGEYQDLVNSRGQSIDPKLLLSWTRKYSQVPLFSFWSFSIGTGKAAGGVTIATQEDGRLAGEMVNNILGNRESAATLPIRLGTMGMGIYSTSELERWGLNVPLGWVVKSD